MILFNSSKRKFCFLRICHKPQHWGLKNLKNSRKKTGYSIRIKLPKKGEDERADFAIMRIIKGFFESHRDILSGVKP